MKTLRYFYHPDHLGSSSVSTPLNNHWITDGSGNAIQHLHYLPFGEDWVDQRNASWSAPYTFSGKEKDVETGYSYFGARYYDSGLSIWLSVDPMSDKYPNLTPYAYCANNPVILVDPDGRDWIKGEDGQISYTDEITSAKQFEQSNMKGTYLGKTHIENGKYYSLFGQELDSESMIGKLTQKIDEAFISYANYHIGLKKGVWSNGPYDVEDHTPNQPDIDFSKIMKFDDSFYTTSENIHNYDPKSGKKITYANLADVTFFVTGRRMSGKFSSFSSREKISGNTGYNVISGTLLYITNTNGRVVNKIAVLNFNNSNNLNKFKASFYKLFPELQQ
ncbi:MAG TPA: RHS repeat-associated core domain-containing protein [Bacteroidales bacterium]|nr:RHS repeat-associated core domain-containing protein [Bacteroidales bacterium]HPB56974.1 RHS repeat-associated core domain-containing protein [Bacteroidales bacterium]HQQ20885.1 RHS repeat-associated core domain-containing protein [Bacteroidales bacterium]